MVDIRSLTVPLNVEDVDFELMRVQVFSKGREQNRKSAVAKSDVGTARKILVPQA